MKHIILPLILVTCLKVGAQNTTDTTKKSDGRVLIPGTHVSMILPKGFKPARDFNGIEKDDKTYIVIFDPYESDYTLSSGGFSRPIFENQGMDVFTYKTLNVGSYPAKYAGMKSSSGYRKYELLFGDSTFSVKLVGHCSVNDDDAGKGIETALLSIKYEKNAKVNPYTHTYFKLNDSVSRFKFTKISDKTFNYSPDGKLKIDDNDDAAMTATTFTLDAPMSNKEWKKTLENIYKKDGMTGIKVKNESESDVNGYTAYESEIYGKINGKPTLIYQLTISNNGNALLIMGVATTDIENNLAEFRKLAHTIDFPPQNTH